MKVCILGANGQIGNELGKSIYDHSKFYLSSISDINICKLSRDDFDFKDFEKLEKALNDFSPNVLINAAAYTDVDNAEDNEAETYKINSELPRKLGEICSKLDSILVHISTDYVFNGNSSQPYNEEDNIDPIGIYGKSKFDGENNIRKLCKKHIIIRTAWVFGNKGKNFVKTMIQLGKNQNEINVVKDQIGSPTSVSSISNAISIIIFKMQNSGIEDKRWGTYHFCGLPYVSWADFATEIFEQAHDKGLISSTVSVKRISSHQFKSKARRPKNSKLECKKIELNFGLKYDNWKKSLDILLRSWVKEND